MKTMKTVLIYFLGMIVSGHALAQIDPFEAVVAKGLPPVTPAPQPKPKLIPLKAACSEAQNLKVALDKYFQYCQTNQEGVNPCVDLSQLSFPTSNLSQEQKEKIIIFAGVFLQKLLENRNALKILEDSLRYGLTSGNSPYSTGGTTAAMVMGLKIGMVGILPDEEAFHFGQYQDQLLNDNPDNQFAVQSRICEQIIKYPRLGNEIKNFTTHLNKASSGLGLTQSDLDSLISRSTFLDSILHGRLPAQNKPNVKSY